MAPTMTQKTLTMATGATSAAIATSWPCTLWRRIFGLSAASEGFGQLRRFGRWFRRNIRDVTATADGRRRRRVACVQSAEHLCLDVNV
uniref:Uncharacterized protein n=1 Tax=Ixodes ricinus TaxID=34613 RepID=A0A6B0TZZ7_IXORI